MGTTNRHTTHPRPLNVLVVGTDDWAIDQAATLLEDAGHHSARCHASGEPPFPCNAFIPGRICPLGLGLDAVLSVRPRPVPGPTPGEMGVVCALRDGEPLVVAGLSDHNPYAGLTTRSVDRHLDIPSACEGAVAAGPATQNGEVCQKPA